MRGRIRRGVRRRSGPNHQPIHSRHRRQYSGIGVHARGRKGNGAPTPSRACSSRSTEASDAVQEPRMYRGRGKIGHHRRLLALPILCQAVCLQVESSPPRTPPHGGPGEFQIRTGPSLLSIYFCLVCSCPQHVSAFTDYLSRLTPKIGAPVHQ